MSEQKGWIHDQVAELLSAYIDGEVTAAEQGLVEAHLASCAVCGRDLATLRQTVTLLRQLPQVAAPRPFTLRESDVQPLRPTRSAWWQSGWLRGAVAATAMLLCVAVAGGALLLERGMIGAPAAPAPVALQSQSQAPAATQAAEAAPGARGEAEKGAGNVAPAPTAPAQPQREAAAAEAAATAPQAATAAPAAAPAAKALQAETPSEPAPSPTAAPAPAFAKPFAPLATPTPALAAPLAPASPPGPSRSYGGASPTASPPATPEMATQQLDQAATAAGAGPTTTPEPQVAATMLWEVQDLSLVIEPGVITASGRLPVGRGLRLAAQLLRDGQPTDWTMPETRPIVTGVNGRFFLRLRARAGAPDYDLFAVAPATYMIRVYPAIPPGVRPGEAHITFDTYRPPTAEPTATLPAPATPTPAPARSAAPAGAAPTASDEAAPAMPAGRRRGSLASLLTLCGAGLAVLFSAGLAAFHSLWIGSDRRQ